LRNAGGVPVDSVVSDRSSSLSLRDKLALALRASV